MRLCRISGYVHSASSPVLQKSSRMMHVEPESQHGCHLVTISYCAHMYAGMAKIAHGTCVYLPSLLSCGFRLQVLLQPSRDVLAKRVKDRAAEGTHFMPASLLDSQLALMEVDSSAYRYGARNASSPSLACTTSVCSVDSFIQHMSVLWLRYIRPGLGVPERIPYVLMYMLASAICVVLQFSMLCRW